MTVERDMCPPRSENEVPAHFADRLMAAIDEKNSRVCVGIDPVPERMPDVLLPPDGKWTERNISEAFNEFCSRIIRAVADHAAVVKFNSAFFEALSPLGVGLLDSLVTTAADLGLVTILDAKRSDIGSTAAAYARAVFGRYPADQGAVPDAVTVNPYLGSDGIMPFLAEADELGTGIFVLVKTSNPSSAELQDLDAGGWPVYRHIAELVQQWGESRIGESGWSSVGAVAGATWPRQLVELREAMPHTPLLVPGYGAQGGGAEDVVAAFDEEGLGAVVNSSRGIIYASDRDPYADRFGPAEWDRA
ncbi:MAG: orotidine-5'-phosphate decarboxylase, partial [Armatimonadia bacterium]|nr:orotidine-5'-phosphate decarboxylase [Armatimonadia bacterium]